jgi:CspA family cold shock protein
MVEAGCHRAIYFARKRLWSRGYQSQIDGFWRFAAPFSFFPCPLARKRPPDSPGRRIRRKLHMPVGTVKFFNDDKGYGFIAPEDGGSDAFVHITAVQRAGMDTLSQNQRLGYELETGRNGRTSAVNLQPAD